uniref:hypothetical chloroplast RF66 n=1 Tax=Hormidiella parvula TaxID=2058785 RepID=UPI00286C0C5A|nr:hypothetical chloroplast RF66 [Hormidiella parvula]WKT06000.1 hypothetical chloroplast RF66 [Hormidiella parvula]
MINVEVGPSTMLGVALVSAGILLYSVRAISPWLSKDHDVLFSTLGLLTGGILIFQGWRLDPILLFCQICSTGTAFFFAWESLQLRLLIQDMGRSCVSDSAYTPDEVRDACDEASPATRIVPGRIGPEKGQSAWNRGYITFLDYRDDM